MLPKSMVCPNMYVISFLVKNSPNIRSTTAINKMPNIKNCLLVRNSSNLVTLTLGAFQSDPTKRKKLTMNCCLMTDFWISALVKKFSHGLQKNLVLF
jgi:hypothetical protein